MLEIMRDRAGRREAGTGFAFPSQTACPARDTGLDPDRVRAIERLAARRGCGAATHPEMAEGPERRKTAERPAHAGRERMQSSCNTPFLSA